MLDDNTSIAEIVACNSSIVTLKINRQTNCGGCENNSSCCGVASLGSFFSSKAVIFQAKNKLNLKLGDKVVISFSSKELIKSSMLAYLLPIVIFLGFALVGVEIKNYFAIGSELIVILFAVLAMFVAGLFIKTAKTEEVEIKNKLI